MTNHPELPDFEALKAPALTHTYEGDVEVELARLYRVEAAALAVTGSMHRRDGTVSSPSLATFDFLKELDAALQQETLAEEGGVTT